MVVTEIKFSSIDSNLTEIRYLAMQDWLIDNLGESQRDRMWRWVGGRWWIDGTYSVMFTNSADATLFVLRWS
jgi:hypothetical protein